MKTTTSFWSLEKQALAAYTTRQLNQFFLDGPPIEAATVETYLAETMRRTEVCFREIRKKYYFENGAARFDHLNSDHYAMFLYLLSNTAFRADGHSALATKMFLLNKALHGLDAFYAVELPEVFLFVHPVGTVLGNARYGNYFAVYQNCTIGTDQNDGYPELSEGTILFSGSSVIGTCHLGRDVVLGAHTFLLNTDVPDHTVVVGSYPHLKYSPNKKSVIDRIFR